MKRAIKEHPLERGDILRNKRISPKRGSESEFMQQLNGYSK
jgi:hypothetical protein